MRLCEGLAWGYRKRYSHYIWALVSWAEPVLLGHLPGEGPSRRHWDCQRVGGLGRGTRRLPPSFGVLRGFGPKPGIGHRSRQVL